jgi:hypothetical protein
MNPLKQVAPIDPATGMPVAQPQLGQMAQNPNPNQNALGSAQAAKIPGLFPGSAFNQNQKTFGILNAKNSKEAGISEAKRLAAQKAEAKKAAAKGAAEGVAEVSQDVVDGEVKTVSAPRKTFSQSSSKTIYNKDGSVSATQTIK